MVDRVACRCTNGICCEVDDPGLRNVRNLSELRSTLVACARPAKEFVRKDRLAPEGRSGERVFVCEPCAGHAAGYLVAAPPHTRDEACTLDPNGGLYCIVCGTSHADPCVTCGGKGFHLDGCKDSDATEPVV
jgi:hypothetical protein